MTLKILYMGTPEFAVPPLTSLIKDTQYKVVGVFTKPDARAGRGKKMRFSPVKEVALQNNIPVFQPNSIKKQWDETVSFLSTLDEIDVGVVCAYGQILPEKMLNLPKHGCINIHASLLPKWRGAAPIHRAILHGDTTSGITLMQMDKGLDTGDWYLKEEVDITEETTTGELHDALSLAGATLLTNNLLNITTGKLKSIAQEDKHASYAKKIDKAEGKIDWNLEPRALCRHIHAMSPFPGAFSHYNGKRVKIFRVTAANPFHDKALLPPGTIYHTDSTNLDVCCHNGVISLQELQLEGKSKLSIRDFLAGSSFQTGDTFS